MSLRPCIGTFARVAKIVEQKLPLSRRFLSSSSQNTFDRNATKAAVVKEKDTPSSSSKLSDGIVRATSAKTVAGKASKVARKPPVAVEGESLAPSTSTTTSVAGGERVNENPLDEFTRLLQSRGKKTDQKYNASKMLLAANQARLTHGDSIALTHKHALIAILSAVEALRNSKERQPVWLSQLTLWAAERLVNDWKAAGADSGAPVSKICLDSAFLYFQFMSRSPDKRSIERGTSAAKALMGAIRAAGHPIEFSTTCLYIRVLLETRDRQDLMKEYSLLQSHADFQSGTSPDFWRFACTVAKPCFLSREVRWGMRRKSNTAMRYRNDVLGVLNDLAHPDLQKHIVSNLPWLEDLVRSALLRRDENAIALIFEKIHPSPDAWDAMAADMQAATAIVSTNTLGNARQPLYPSFSEGVRVQLMHLAVKMENFDMAKRLLNCWKRAGAQPRPIDYVAAVSVLSRNRNKNSDRSLLKEMLLLLVDAADGMDSQPLLARSVESSFSEWLHSAPWRVSSLEKMLVDMTRQDKLVPKVALNALIMSAGRGHMMPVAMRIFSNYEGLFGIKPDLSACNAFLSAVTSSFKPNAEMMLRLLEEMEMEGMEPNSETYTHVVSLLAGGGNNNNNKNSHNNNYGNNGNNHSFAFASGEVRGKEDPNTLFLHAIFERMSAKDVWPHPHALRKAALFFARQHDGQMVNLILDLLAESSDASGVAAGTAGVDTKAVAVDLNFLLAKYSNSSGDSGSANDAKFADEVRVAWNGAGK